MLPIKTDLHLEKFPEDATKAASENIASTIANVIVTDSVRNGPKKLDYKIGGSSRIMKSPFERFAASSPNFHPDPVDEAKATDDLLPLDFALAKFSKDDLKAIEKAGVEVLESEPSLTEKGLTSAQVMKLRDRGATFDEIMRTSVDDYYKILGVPVPKASEAREKDGPSRLLTHELTDQLIDQEIRKSRLPSANSFPERGPRNQPPSRLRRTMTDSNPFVADSKAKVAAWMAKNSFIERNGLQDLINPQAEELTGEELHKAFSEFDLLNLNNRRRPSVHSQLTDINKAILDSQRPAFITSANEDQFEALKKMNLGKDKFKGANNKL